MGGRIRENHVVAIVGMCGAGKSIVADRFEGAGYAFLRFGQVVLDIVKERGLEPTEENERPIREGVRKKHGMGAMAILNLPKIQKMLDDSDVVVDGLYSWSEYKILKEKFGDRLVVVAVYAPPVLRHKRISERKLAADDTDLRHRPFSPEDARSRDYSEIENLEKGGPIAEADHTLLNTSTIEDFRKHIDALIEKLKEGF